MKHRVDAPRVIEEQEVERAKRWTLNSVTLEEIVEVVQDSFGSPSRSGRKKDYSRMMTVSHFFDQRMIFSSGGQLPHAVAMNQPLGPTALEKVLVIRPRSFRKRHQNYAAVE
jgi:hypothetical protein